MENENDKNGISINNNEEIKIQLENYKINFEILKTQQDSYFKRVQVIYAFLEGILFIAFYNLINNPIIYIRIISSTIAILGFIISLIWNSAIKRSNDYMKLSKDELRLIEKGLTEIKKFKSYPLMPRYYTRESDIYYYGNDKTEKKDIATTENKNITKKALIKRDSLISKIFSYSWILIFLLSIIREFT